MIPAHEATTDLLDLADQLAHGAVGFRAAVYAAVRCIPPGKVLGYGQVAAILGRARAARQVGFALAALDAHGCAPDGQPVPWWRVPRSDGSIAMQGDSTRGPRQIAHLAAEGVQLQGNRVPMDRYGWQVPVDG